MSMRGKQYGMIRVAFCLMALLGVPLTAHAGTTLQNAITADATGKNISVSDKGSVGVSVTISGTATATFQGSTDSGTTWASIPCIVLGGTTGVTTASATGQYLCSVAGLTHFQTPVSGCSGCTVTIFAQSSMPSSGSTSSGAPISSLGTANAAAPTLVEAAPATFSFDLSGNVRMTMGTLLSGEDQTNNLIMTSGGAVRTTTFSSMTSATTSSVTTVPIGSKTFVVQIINATSETKAATVSIYGNLISSTTGGILLCTVTLPSTATTLQLQDACPVVTANFPYYFYTATVYTSASSAPLTVYANY